MCTFVFSFTGSEFYLGYVPHFATPPSVIIINDGVRLLNYSIEAPVTGYHRNGNVTERSRIVEKFPVALTGISYSFSNAQNNAYKEGIYIKVTSRQVSVVGESKGDYNIDTFFALPIEDLHLDEYVYYGVSVSSFTDADGSVVVVGSEDSTMLTITVPVTAKIKINNTTPWSEIVPNMNHSYTINRLQIVYIAAFTSNLIGTRVVTNKPVSVFSGHECAWVPEWVQFSCDHLMEQMLPIDLWGTVHYVVPLASRRQYTITIVAAYDHTIVEMRCTNAESINLNAGRSVSRILSNQEFCALHSNNKVLVTQFSHGNSDRQGDPMMTLIPATTHYTNSITSSTIHDPIESSYRHYVNIIVMVDYYQPNTIFNNRRSKPVT